MFSDPSKTKKKKSLAKCASFGVRGRTLWPDLCLRLCGSLSLPLIHSSTDACFPVNVFTYANGPRWGWLGQDHRCQRGAQRGRWWWWCRHVVQGREQGRRQWECEWIAAKAAWRSMGSPRGVSWNALHPAHHAQVDGHRPTYVRRIPIRRYCFCSELQRACVCVCAPLLALPV
jgi:hypothetical protein